ncbi:hypothetical protein K5I29_09390 [Flavobacterium agricola]|uniref:Uncharacterized protein n=1 Tax=Flavobacterium agricola TaxID=2870839 RepID=A0ABY6LWT3_9FLAO|nr:hypothetical protein [Flavobacterium agricola]UYW00731.1 hypothetical protein K5I29_09390 [Flavobacterium agricola]
MNTLKAQQSSNLEVINLEEKTIIANFDYSVLPTTINTDKSNIAVTSFKDKFVVASYKSYAC